MSVRILPFLYFGIILPLSCGRTDFDHLYVPDAGTDGTTDSDVIADIEGCGNGVLETALGEQCDNGENNSNAPNAACRVNCTFARCGDNVVDTLTEECDLGSQNSDEPGSECRTTCLQGGCGDGILDPGEECDEGGLNSDAPGAVCRMNCLLPGCGDGIVDDLTEACDDGNDINTDSCTNVCTVASCGDGIVQTGVEICDDGNTIDDIACSADCLHACGDGTIDTERGETCDDGSLNSDTTPWACRENCQDAACGDAVSDPQQFCLGTPSFLFAGGPGKESTAIDLDGDGLKDLILLTDSAVYVYVRRDLGYQLAWSAAGLTSPRSPMVGDVTGDGLDDLVVVETTARRIAVFTRQSGALPSFGSATRTSLGISVNAGRAVMGQFSSDSSLDIAVLVPYNDNMKILVNSGTGTFSTTTLSTCTRPVGIARGVLSPGGSDDLAVVCNTQNMLAVFANNGNGTFTSTYLSAGSYPVDVQIADMNNDGRQDIVVLKTMQTPVSPEVGIYYQSATGSFSLDSTIAGLSEQAAYIQLGSSTQNNYKDILVSGQTGFSFYLNQKNKTFSTGDHVAWNTPPGRILWKDLNGDLIADLVISGGSSAGFTLSTDRISLPLPPQHSLPALAQAGVVVDFTADGNNDAVLVSYDDRIFVAAGDGSGEVGSVSSFNAPGIWSVGAIGDPVAPDLVTIIGGSTQSNIVANPGGLMSSNTTITTPGTTPVAIISKANLDGDLYYDTAVLFQDSASLLVISGGTTPTTASFPIGTSPTLLAMGPLDANASADFLVLDANGSSVYSLTNNGSGSFSGGYVGNLPYTSPSAIALLDIDGDGISELVCAHLATKTLHVYGVDLSDSSLTHLASISLDCSPKSFITGDHDASFGQDLMVLCSDNSRVVWLYSTGTELTPSSALERISLYPFDSCTSGDMDHDGTDDLICPTASGHLTILRAAP
ncbi:VCBS repeat-containing protein [Myxococcota bacterium]|nr:VCBS repeat-containing protein [Myxococcota bacterium]MBU1535209.1 VCBS repeat-containing protein [Myxococcota bacterium]